MSGHGVEEGRVESRTDNTDFPGFAGNAAESDNQSFTDTAL